MACRVRVDLLQEKWMKLDRQNVSVKNMYAGGTAPRESAFVCACVFTLASTLQESRPHVGAGMGGEEGVGMEAEEVEGDGGEVKGARLAGEGVPLMLAA